MSRTPPEPKEQYAFQMNRDNKRVTQWSKKEAYDTEFMPKTMIETQM
jgi:hypothetical protein